MPEEFASLLAVDFTLVLMVGGVERDGVYPFVAISGDSVCLFGVLLLRCL